MFRRFVRSFAAQPVVHIYVPAPRPFVPRPLG